MIMQGVLACHPDFVISNPEKQDEKSNVVCKTLEFSLHSK